MMNKEERDVLIGQYLKRMYLGIGLLLVLTLVTLAGCSQAGGEGSTGIDVSESSAGAKVNEDFSQNVNVNRASDYAKNELPLPVEGIGRGISTAVKADKKYKIAVVTRNQINPYMLGMWAGGVQAGKDMGVEIDTKAPTEDKKIEEELTIIESKIQEGYDAFVIHPSDSEGIQPVIDECNEKGIPVVAIGTAPKTGAFMRTGVDYYETGYLVAKALCEKAGGKGKAVILEGPSGVQNMEERKAGITDAIGEYPDMEIVASQTANSNRKEGMDVMENLLKREDVGEGLTIVACCNDEMAMGAIQALKAAKKNDVYVGGADGSADASKAIRDGDMYATYNCDPYGSTYLAITYLVQYLNDKTLPEEYFVPFPSERHNPLITKDNVEEYIEKYRWFE